MADRVFNSFSAAGRFYKESSWAVKDAVYMSLPRVGAFVRDIIRNKHGVKQPGRAKGTNPTPLVKSGSLRDAVAYRIVNVNSVEVFSEKNWLAVIHEYGATFRMTDRQRKRLFANVFNDPSMKKLGRPRATSGYIRIPARPIRRIVGNDPTVSNGVADIISKAVNKVFNH